MSNWPIPVLLWFCDQLIAEREKARAHKAAYYRANKERICRSLNEYRRANPELIRRQKAEHYRKYQDAYRKQKAEYCAGNKDKVRESRAKYYRTHKEQIRQRDVAYRVANAEKIRKRKRAYYDAHREEILFKEKIRSASRPLSKEQRQRRSETRKRRRARSLDAHREKDRVNMRRYLESSARNRLAKRMRDRVRAAVKSRGTAKNLKTLALLGCDWPTLKAHFEQRFAPGMNWDNMSRWHIDHIRPCASFDLSDPEQQKQCFHYTNLQPLWAAENFCKQAKYAA